jgi:ketosteroid isomerase-like protein
MKKLTLLLMIAFSISGRCIAQQESTKEEIIKMEHAFADAIKAQDTVKAAALQADSYFLAIGIQGMPIQTVSKSQWLANLKYYVTESYSIDDMKVNVHGGSAVVMMLFTQKATVRGSDRSAQFVITDIWTKEKSGWKISERHSGRPEQPAARK